MNKKICRYPRFGIATLTALAAAALLFSAGCSSGNKGFWNEIQLGEVDLDSIAQGSYAGEYEAGPVKAVVSVEVAGGRIPSRVLRTQSMRVDTVTRATASSMVILKAIEIALTR